MASNKHTGTVIRTAGSTCDVLGTDGAVAVCRIKGNFRIKGIRTTNPVAVGDIVDYGDPAFDGVSLIFDIHPRRNYIIRRATNLSKSASILAANLDAVMLVLTLAHPVTSLTFIDRFLASACAYDVPASLIINKTDLLDTSEDRELLDAVAGLYRFLGYPVYCVSTVTGEGLDTLRDVLRDRLTLLSGNSGVGKSSLINRIVPGACARTAAISAVHDSGTHTTTFSEIFELPGGGRIIDTPGVRGFGTVDFAIEEVSHYFPEIFEISRGCRFDNCTHTHEPGCAVLEALEEQRIAQSRYNSYLSILDEIRQGDKYRKPY